MLKHVPLITLILLLLSLNSALGRGGTMEVAWKGQLVQPNPAWPGGVLDLINDETRTGGWRPYFSGALNDVTHYAFEITSMDDLNRLVRKLAASKTTQRRIRLSYEKEPTGLGYVSMLPKGNGSACIFSISDQPLRGQGRPNNTALPPTLTLYVQNKFVDLDKLEVPDGIEVSQGSVVSLGSVSRQTLDAPSRECLAEIETFIARRTRQQTDER